MAGDELKDRFRILCIDGGGIRGLISALVIAEIERRLEARGRSGRLADCFHLFAGTSTGGLIALALTRPEPVPGPELARFYIEDGPKIFHRNLWHELATGWGWWGPKYSDAALRETIQRRIGETRLADSSRDLLVTSYDMTERQPFFFKRWKARQDPDWNWPVLDAALSTAAAPTYFPSHGLAGRALVDGGVFAANPTVAAIAEALGRNNDPPARLSPEELLVVSIGTGEFNTGFSQAQVGGWGRLGWLLGGGDEPPVLAAMLGGSSDGSDYWAHMLLNHEPGEPRPSGEGIGRGERYYRFQVDLQGAVAMDDKSPNTLEHVLPDAATRLIAERDAEIDALVERLTPVA